MSGLFHQMLLDRKHPAYHKDNHQSQQKENHISQSIGDHKGKVVKTIASGKVVYSSEEVL